MVSYLNAQCSDGLTYQSPPGRDRVDDVAAGVFEKRDSVIGKIFNPFLNTFDDFFRFPFAAFPLFVG